MEQLHDAPQEQLHDELHEMLHGVPMELEQLHYEQLEMHDEHRCEWPCVSAVHLCEDHHNAC